MKTETGEKGHSASRNTARAVRTYRWILVAILLVAAVLRLWGLGTSPGWFLDEGTYFDVARNLLHGKRQVGQMAVTFAAPHMTAPPAWFLAEAAWMAVFGQTMTAFRWLVALCGVACVGLTAGIGRRLGGWKAGLWAAGFLAVAPRAVLYSRLAIPYTPATTAALIWIGSMLVWESGGSPRRRGFFLVAGCLAAALSPLTLYYGAVVIPAGLVWAAAAWVGWKRGRRRRSPWPLLLPPVCATVALGSFLAYGWIAWGEAFRLDFRALRANVAPAPPATFLRHWIGYLFHWTTYSGPVEWVRGVLPFFGFAGLFFLRRRAASLAVGATGFAFALIVLRRLDATVAFVDYPMMTVFPFLCLGLGMLAGRRIWGLFGRGRSRQRTARNGEESRSPLSRGAIGKLVVAGGVGVLLAGYSFVALGSGWKKPNPPTTAFGMIPSLADARAAAERASAFVLNREKGNGAQGLVLASTNLWPLLTVPHGDISQLMAARGRGSGFYKYDCAAEASKALREERIGAVIEGPFTEWRRRPVYTNENHLPPGSPWIDLAHTIDEFHRTWPVAFQAGDYTVRVPPAPSRTKTPAK